jgi:hypothetical protein
MIHFLVDSAGFFDDLVAGSPENNKENNFKFNNKEETLAP